MTTSKRVTRQRLAVQKVFEETGNGRALSVHEILELARKRVPGIGIATVYRKVKELSEERWLRIVEFPGDALRYEREDKHEHHHFKCLECDRVFDIPCDPHLYDELLPEGFRLLRHELFLYGRCAEHS